MVINYKSMIRSVINVIFSIFFLLYWNNFFYLLKFIFDISALNNKKILKN